MNFWSHKDSTKRSGPFLFPLKTPTNILRDLYSLKPSFVYVYKQKIRWVPNFPHSQPLNATNSNNAVYYTIPRVRYSCGQHIPWNYKQIL